MYDTLGLMLTRRDLFAGLVLIGRPVSAKASLPTTPINFAVPSGACDCHTHIIGDPAKFPFAANRVYTPEPASPEEPQASLGLAQPGWNDLADLVRSSKAYVKLSAAYRASTQPPDYPDVAPFAKVLAAANPNRILWGTDWPHTNSTSSGPATEVTPLLAIDDGRLLNQLAAWVPDAAVRKRILVDNPAQLYGF